MPSVGDCVWCRVSACRTGKDWWRTGEGLGRTGGGRRGLVAEEWSKLPKLEAQTSNEDWRRLEGFVGLLVCWSAGPGGSAPQTKLGSWVGVGVTWGGWGSIYWLELSVMD